MFSHNSAAKFILREGKEGEGGGMTAVWRRGGRRPVACRDCGGSRLRILFTASPACKKDGRRPSRRRQSRLAASEWA